VENEKINEIERTRVRYPHRGQPLFLKKNFTTKKLLVFESKLKNIFGHILLIYIYVGGQEEVHQDGFFGFSVQIQNFVRNGQNSCL
jgi:hypothetical protein